MKWTHNICIDCWNKQKPNREPLSTTVHNNEKCCFCGNKTNKGIYIRQDPNDKILKCGGKC